MHPQCRTALVAWALLLPPMLRPGSPWASPAFSFLALVDIMRGEGEKESHTIAHGGFALWDEEELWLAEQELHP